MNHLIHISLLGLTAALALFLASACAPQDPPPPAAVESFPVGRFPRDLAFDGRHLWVVNLGSESVTKLSRDGQTVGDFPAGTLPQALTFDGRYVWVATSLGEVVKLSRDGKVLLNVEVGGILTSIVSDGRYLWVADTMGGAISRLHLSGRIEGVFEVGVKPVDLLHDGDHLWVANVGDDTVLKLDANGRVLLTVHVEQPGALAFDGKDIWATNTGFPSIPGSTVTRLDVNGRMLGVYQTGSDPRAIIYADEIIWVANSLNDFSVTGATLTKLSLDGRNLGSFRVGSQPEALLHDGSGLWIIDRVTNAVSKMNARATPHVPPPETRPLPVERDPGYPRGLGAAGINPFHPLHPWLTDFSLHSVPYDEIAPGGPARDEITPLDNPAFATTSEAGDWLLDAEPVLFFRLYGDARAYPLRVLIWHEIVNDVVAEVPVAVTYCPLCNSAVVLKRTLEGTVYDFGTTGYLRHFDLIMWDRQTESWWQQFTGEAIIGELTGKRLEFLPASIIPWKEFRDAHPNGQVLSQARGYGRPYGKGLYPEIDLIGERSPTQEGPGGVSLPVMERIVGVTIDDLSIAFDYQTLARKRVVNHTIGETDLVVFYEPETLSPFQDLSEDSNGRSVGATGVFSPHADGRKLTFKFTGVGIVDEETGTRWNLLGHAVEGPLTGQRLTPRIYGDYFWFAWLAFNPATQTYTP